MNEMSTEYKDLRDEFSRYTEAQMATVESLKRTKRTAKYELNRAMAIRDDMLAICLRHRIVTDQQQPNNCSRLMEWMLIHFARVIGDGLRPTVPWFESIGVVLEGRYSRLMVVYKDRDDPPPSDIFSKFRCPFSIVLRSANTLKPPTELEAYVPDETKTEAVLPQSVQEVPVPQAGAKDPTGQTEAHDLAIKNETQDPAIQNETGGTYRVTPVGPWGPDHTRNTDLSRKENP